MKDWKGYDPDDDEIDSIAEFALFHDLECEEAEQIASENGWFRRWKDYDPDDDGLKTIAEFKRHHNMSKQGATELANRYGWFPDRAPSGSSRIAAEADAAIRKIVPKLCDWTPTAQVVKKARDYTRYAVFAALKRAEKSGEIESDKRGPLHGGIHWRKK